MKSKLFPKMKMKNRVKILIISVILLIGAGCAYKAFRPQSGDYHIEDGFAIVRADSLSIAIRPQSYRGMSDLGTNNYFPIYVQVKNLGKTKKSFPIEAFSIVANKMQYDHIPMDYILGDYQRRLYLSQWDAMQNDSPSLVDQRQKDVDGYYNLMSAALSFGDILPGATKEGYLFYSPAVRKSESFIVDVFGKEVHFAK